MEAKMIKLCELLEEVSKCFLNFYVLSLVCFCSLYFHIGWSIQHLYLITNWLANITTCLYVDLCLILLQAVAQTKDNIVKKQALTYEEIEAEREEVSEIIPKGC